MPMVLARQPLSVVMDKLLCCGVAGQPLSMVLARQPLSMMLARQPLSVVMNIFVCGVTRQPPGQAASIRGASKTASVRGYEKTAMSVVVVVMDKHLWQPLSMVLARQPLSVVTDKHLYL